MSGFLFNDIIFGPVRSRRLGLSLGINLLPLHRKHCSYNCIYCECGWTPKKTDQPLLYPDRKVVSEYLEQRMKEMVAEQYIPDALTYAGNGEPTLHPEFDAIVDDTLRLRDRYMPGSRVSVLSNASRIDDDRVFNALLKIDNNILKLDAGTPETFQRINNPVEPVDFERLIQGLIRFDGHVIIQSLFLRGNYNGAPVDNTTEGEVSRWIEHLIAIKPSLVMIYPIARATPLHDLEKVSHGELESIANRVRTAGLEAEIY
jgi:wyosine [tRNA(Phe)-imidazoG37] synthetase (radical SAM superfamily)